MDNRVRGAVPVILDNRVRGAVPVILDNRVREAVPVILDNRVREAVPVIGKHGKSAATKMWRLIFWVTLIQKAIRIKSNIKTIKSLEKSLEKIAAILLLFLIFYDSIIFGLLRMTFDVQ